MNIDFEHSEWEASVLQDGSVLVQMSGGGTFTVKNDGVTGYDFVVPYLNEMRKHYPGHIEAADMLLNRMLGDRYIFIQKNRRVYDSCLAVMSLSCAFGNLDHQADRERSGEYHPEFTGCPFRAFCPFNGYSPRNAEKRTVCCNPIYETGLSKRELDVAMKLVDTELSVAEIAATLHVSTGHCKSVCNDVYKHMGVNSRQELVKRLKNKRIMQPKAED